ncbi:uncharacterized protein LOC128743290 isoform X2 [Sabethes cyaneus]|uniref:uncharacterized protein LOC128743290 isoform X2 n=1 Tax=Sabethes cyaneus TaxID=53552 RepID=UPI00237DBC0D|nr:uncharacterized protein LOC128743290 isoform X2 [Sabethes cyaneus]
MKPLSNYNIPSIDSDSAELFVRENGFSLDGKRSQRKTRSKLLEKIDVEILKVEKLEKQTSIAVMAVLTETTTATYEKTKKRSALDNKEAVSHNVVAEIKELTGALQSVRCTECEKNKAKCVQIYPYILWLQVHQKENHHAGMQDDNAAKKIKQETIVDKTSKPNTLKPGLKDFESLPKLKKEPVQASPVQINAAMNLSLFHLIREYSGNDALEFLQFCTERMQEENCFNAQILTVEQADTDLWHELRKGRITASRIHEASRCTMLNGSLTNKIMGISSGFSFAMKRGTDLEGHVLAVLKKQYPSLRSTGLVLDPQFPWMGASPDGISDDFVLEIKCPYTPNTYQCYIDVKKLSKKYFAQIQLQMHMTHKTKALLGVAALDFEKTRNVTQVWIDYDREYVSAIMEEAFEFWKKGVFPALLRKRKSKK